MDEALQFASRAYGEVFVLLLVARGMDIISTWMATPGLVLEGNPIAKMLGWRWGIPLNLAFCFGFAFWPFPAIVIGTTSVLVAARNFQSAWLMRSMGEAAYRDWHLQRVQETSITLYLLCLFGQTALTAAVGAAVIRFSDSRSDDYGILLAIGWGIVGYAVTVAFYTVLGVWRLRRAALRRQRLTERALGDPVSPLKPGKLVNLCGPDKAEVP